MTETSISNTHAMEFQSSFLVITTLLFSVLLLAKIYKQKNKGKSTVVPKLPPGPWKLPLIGNLHQLAAAGSLPHHALRDLALKYGPIMHLQMGEISTVIVSSPDLAKDILKTHDLAFAQRPEFFFSEILAYDSTDISFAPYGEYWRQMRKICTLELLSAKRVKSYSCTRQDEVAKLIQSIHLSASASSPFNLSKSIYSLIHTLVSRAAFGKQQSMYEDEILFLIKKTFELIGGFDVSEYFPSWNSLHLITQIKAKLKDTQKRMDKVLDSIVKECRSNHGEGSETLLDVLLRIQQSGDLEFPITDDNIKAVIWDMIVAGSDTSGVVIEWAMSELMKNPRVRQKVQAEIREAFKGKKTINEADLHELTYFKLVIKETFRLHPPGPLLLPRECREPRKIGGYEIPVKTRVIVNAWALKRDPNHWSDPEKFIPERFQDSSLDYKGTNFEYLPFGAGRRMCPGLLLGIANVELSLASLLYHFNWELPDGMKPEDLDMTEIFGAVVGKKNNLYLIPTPYDHAISP